MGLTTKSTSIRFFPNGPGNPLETGLLEDVHLNADPRTNTIIISAPTKTMDLLMKLIQDMDTVSAVQANVKVFPLRRADAVNTATLIQQMFASSGTTGANRTGGANGGGGGGGGARRV